MIDLHIKYGDFNWLSNGYKPTLESYKDKKEEFKNDFEWMNNLPLYYEDDYFIYVHAGVDVNKKIDEQFVNDLLWIREKFILNKKPYYKRVVFGHTPTLLFNHSIEPFFTKGNNIDIDTGCVYGGALTALVIEKDQVKSYYQIMNQTMDKRRYNYGYKH